MIFLFLSIVVNALLIIAFKIFPRFGINSFQAITANYYTASILGFLLSGLNPLTHHSGREIWLMPVIVLGFMFISLFYLISLTTEKIGISVASVSNKMSVVIPVSIAVFLYDEKLSLLQISGIVLAIVAVIFVSLRNGQENGPKVSGWLKIGLPAILFVGCGALDALINYLQFKVVDAQTSNEFLLSFGFSIAGILGTIALLILVASGKQQFHGKSIMTGLLLGIPNFFSMFLVMLGLQSGFLQASEFFSINNIGIVVLASAIGYFGMGEELSAMNKGGIALSVLAIVMLAFG
jgi:drug/metabolite transporter (DMT)-like permease